MESEPHNDKRVEALNAVFAVILREKSVSFTAEFKNLFACLKLYDKRAPSVYGFKNVGEQRDPLICAGERESPRFIERHLVDAGVNSAHPFQCVVVKDDDAPVFGELNVKLRPVSFFASEIE